MNSMRLFVRTISIFRPAAFVMILAALLCGSAVAQEGGFTFGPPLRYNILFSYKLSERVRTALYTSDGTLQDSLERIVTYYLTENQTAPDTLGGRIVLRCNVDSMTVEYSNPITGESLDFNTQVHSDASDVAKVRDREVLAPSVVVNREVAFTLSPYGEVLSIERPGLEDVRAQAETPGIDDFTRQRIEEVIADDYLTSLYFPWRGALPVGRTVLYDNATDLPFSCVLDRLAFRGKVSSRLTRSDKGLLMKYEAKFDKPMMKTLSVTALQSPMNIESAQGTVYGEVKLDEDGVARSAWSGATGSVVGVIEGQKVLYSISHETYVEQMELAPLVVN